MQAMFKHIEQLSIQIGDLRREMHDRFNRIEMILGEMHTEIMNGFVALAKNISNVDLRVELIRTTLKSVERSLSKVNQRLRNYRIEDVHQTYFDYRDSCVNFHDYYNIPMSQDRYVDCIQGLTKFANILSYSSALTSSDVELNNDSLLPALRDYSPEYTIGIAANHIGYPDKGNLVNPIAWANGVNGFMTMVNNNPEYGNVIHPALVERIKSRGELVEEFISYLQADVTPLENLLDKYQTTLNTIYEVLKKGKQYAFSKHIFELHRKQYAEYIKDLKVQIKVIEATHPQGMGGWTRKRPQIIALMKKDIKNLNDAVSFVPNAAMIDAWITENKPLFPMYLKVLPGKNSGEAHFHDLFLLMDPKYTEKTVSDIAQAAWLLGLGKIESNYISAPCNHIDGTWTSKHFGIYSKLTTIQKEDSSISFDLPNLPDNSTTISKEIFRGLFGIGSRSQALTCYPPSLGNYHHLRNVEPYSKNIYLNWKGGQGTMGYVTSYQSRVANTSSQKDLPEDFKEKLLSAIKSKKTEALEGMLGDVFHCFGQLEYQEQLEIAFKELDNNARMMKLLIYFGMNESYNSDFRLRERLSSIGIVLTRDELIERFKRKIVNVSGIVNIDGHKEAHFRALEEFKKWLKENYTYRREKYGLIQSLKQDIDTFIKNMYSSGNNKSNAHYIVTGD